MTIVKKGVASYTRPIKFLIGLVYEPKKGGAYILALGVYYMGKFNHSQDKNNGCLT